MPKLLLLCEYPTLGGGERSMLATLEGIEASGFSPAVICPPQGPLADALRRLDVDVLPFEPRSAAGQRLDQPRLREEMARLLGHHRGDLLHANSLSMGRLSGPVAAELQMPSIAHLRDIVKLSRQAVADLSRHARLLAVSRAAADFHTAAGVPPQKTRVLYNGVDLAEFRPRPGSGYLHRQLRLPPDALLVGTIGQICLRKGQDVLVRAAAEVAGKLKNVHYLIVGARHSEKEESRRFEADLNAAATGPLAGRLHFLGFRDDVEQILCELALLVHPARQEPLGRVLLEAAAAGAAVVATDVGGTGEIFPPESRAARLVPPDDAGALAAAIRQLVADRALRRRLSRAARRRAEEAFDIRDATAALLAHYREVASG